MRDDGQMEKRLERKESDCISSSGVEGLFELITCVSCYVHVSLISCLVHISFDPGLQYIIKQSSRQTQNGQNVRTPLCTYKCWSGVIHGLDLVQAETVEKHKICICVTWVSPQLRPFRRLVTGSESILSNKRSKHEHRL